MKRTATVVAAFVAALVAVDAIAADYTWTGAGDGVTWSNADNWDGGRYVFRQDATGISVARTSGLIIGFK